MQRWLERAVIGLNLCPFARAVHVGQRIRWIVTDATTEHALDQELRTALASLYATPAERIETTILVHPWVLSDFLDYNDFLGRAEAAVAELGLEGEIQVASFHPRYQFAGTAPDDVTNHTNRSPHPALHLLRESSIERALAAFPDATDIYERNIRTLRALGPEGWARLWT